MLDEFIAIKGQDFLIFFWIYSIAIIVLGKWLVKRVDGSNYFTMPSPRQLTTYEIAALREERTGVIHTALFNLWNTQLIEISGKHQHAEIKITSSNNLVPKNTFEAILYRFIAEQPRKPKDFFEQAPFHAHIDQELAHIYSKLEQLHLRRTSKQLKNLKRIVTSCGWLIAGVGGMKLLLGFVRGHPILWLLFSLIVLLVMHHLTFSDTTNHLSQLGKSYLTSLKKHLKNDHTGGYHHDPALKVAALGIAGLSGLTMFYAFQDAFAASDAHKKTLSSGDSGGGCGGSDAGSTGGCGGCGGGGD